MSFYRNTIRKSILITLSQQGICLMIREVRLVPALVSLSKTLKQQTLQDHEFGHGKGAKQTLFYSCFLRFLQHSGGDKQ